MGGGRRGTLGIRVPFLLDGQDLGITVSDDLVVERVQDHRAFQFGWAVGDKLLKVNGVRVRTYAEYSSELQIALQAHSAKGTALGFSVRRSGGTAPEGGGGGELPRLTFASRPPGRQGSSGGEEQGPLLEGCKGESKKLEQSLREYFGERFDSKDVERRIEEIVAETERWISGCHVDHAVVVKTRRTSPFSNAVMCVLTLGIYLFLRPSTDIAVLVITTEGRVILVKNIHPQLGGSGGGGIMARAMWYLGILLVISLLPIAIVYLCANLADHFLRKASAIKVAAPADIFAQAPEQHEQTNVVQHIWNHRALVYYAIIVALWVVFMLWVWVNRQRGYGTRFYREYKAKDISAVQYTQEDYHRCNCFCSRRRRGSLRLFFGKYPDGAELNTRISPNMPLAGAAVPSAKPGTAYDTNTTPHDGGGDVETQASRVFPCVSVLLILTAVLAQVFTIYGYYQEFLLVREAYAFCNTARLEQMCTQDHCKQFAVREDLPNYQFCEHVQWMKPESLLDDRDCDGAVGGECCVGCTMGQFMVSVGYGDATVWTQHVDDTVNNVALILALVSGAIAVRAFMSNVKETPELDVDFVQDFYQSDSTEYAMTDELVLKFLSDTFAKAGRAKKEEDGQQTKTAKWQELDPKNEDDEPMPLLPEFDVKGRLTKHSNWYEFSKRRRILEYTAKCQHDQANISVPIRCLGFMEGEAVYAAWTEMPHMTNTEAIFIWVATLLAAAAVVYWPDDLGGPLVDTGEEYCSGQGEDREGGTFQAVLCYILKPLVVAISTLIIAPLSLYLKFLLTCLLSQCVVIVTEERVFAVYYSWSVWKFFCCSCCEVPMALRVEVFRHGDQVFYGRMNSRTPPWYVRYLSPTRWTTGEVNMQSKFGNLMLERHFGEVDPLYHLVATVLCSDVSDIDFSTVWKELGEKNTKERPIWRFGVEEDSVKVRHGEKNTKDVNLHHGDAAGGTDGESEDHAAGVCCLSCGACGGAATTRTPSRRQHIEWIATENPETIKRRVCYVASAEEEPIFLWSFKETGLLNNPCDNYNDIVVTTDRIRLISEEEYKAFDCRTWLCWGACWCACLRRTCCPHRLRKMRSFLNYSHLEAFSTETSVQPSLCPLNCPCYTACCAALTSCFSCSACPKRAECCAPPGTAKPRVQIWLKWMQRYAKTLNPDLMLSVRPYKLDEFEEEGKKDDGTGDEDRSCCGLHSERLVGQRTSDQDDVTALRNLMEEVLKCEDKDG